MPGCTSAAQCVLPNAVDSGAGVVVAGAAPAAVHPDAECRRRRVLDRRVRADRARRQRLGPRRRQHAGSACCPATTSSTTTGSTIRIPAQQGGANVPGFDALTIGRAQLCVARQQQDVRPEPGQRIPCQLHAQREQRRHAERRPRRQRSRRRASSPAPARPASSCRRRSSKASRTSCSTSSRWA